MSTFHKWKAKIEQGNLTRHNVVTLAKYAQGSREMPDDEVDTLVDLVETLQPTLSAEHTQQGLAWFSKLAEWKPIKYDPPLTDYQRDVLADFDHFRLVGFWETKYNIHTGRVYQEPVYRVIARDGRFFDYVPGPRYMGDTRKMESYGWFTTLAGPVTQIEAGRL